MNLMGTSLVATRKYICDPTLRSGRHRVLMVTAHTICSLRTVIFFFFSFFEGGGGGGGVGGGGGWGGWGGNPPANRS